MTQREDEARPDVDAAEDVASASPEPSQDQVGDDAADADLDAEFAQGVETAQSIADAAEAEVDAQSEPTDDVPAPSPASADATEQVDTPDASTPDASTPDASTPDTEDAAGEDDPTATTSQTEDSTGPAVAAATSKRVGRVGAGLRSRTDRRSRAAKRAAAGSAAGMVAVSPPVAVRPVKAPISDLRQKVESTAALRESLDAKEAEAKDLRASIERLRQELDSETTTDSGARTATNGSAASHPAGGTSATGHPAAGGGTATVTAAGPHEPGLRWPMIALAAAMTLLLIWLLSRCTGSTTAEPGASATAGAGSTASSSLAPGGAAPIPTDDPTPMPWGGAQVTAPPELPTNGVGINEPGDLVEFTLNDDNRSFDIYESFLSESPTTDSLALSLPTAPGAPKPTPVGLQVSLDGRPATVTAQGTNAWQVDSKGQQWTRAVIRYQLAKAVALSRPGRAEGVVVSLAGKRAPIMVFRSTDDGVVQMSCQQTPDAKALSTLCQRTEELPGGGTAHNATVDPNLLPAVSLSLNVPK